MKNILLSVSSYCLVEVIHPESWSMSSPDHYRKVNNIIPLSCSSSSLTCAQMREWYKKVISPVQSPFPLSLTIPVFTTALPLDPFSLPLYLLPPSIHPSSG